MKKVISCMICALLLVGCMAGCGSTGGRSGSGNGIKIMMSLSQGDDFRNTIVEQAKKTAQEKGATLDVYDEDGVYMGQYTKQITLQHGYGDGMELSCERSVAAVSRLF